MKPVEYVLQIDVFTPETLPLARLAEYLAAMAKMIGYQERAHFLGVERGSAKLRAAIDSVDAPKVESRLAAIALGTAPKDALGGKLEIEALLANDNAVGELIEVASGRTVIPFIGRNRPKPLAFPPFREETSIEGHLVSIGGRDKTAHATLQDGDIFHTGVTMNREMARELSHLLYGPVLRLHGSGRFERLGDGAWRMTDFRTSRYERLDDRRVTEVLAKIRSIPGNAIMTPDAYLVQQSFDQRDESEK